MFLNRQNEIVSLKKRYSNSSAELIIIYGRRRIGKSELIDQFLSDSVGVRILARQETKELQLKQVSAELTNLYRDHHLKSVAFPDWDSVFFYLQSHAEERVVLAFDEFPYLVKEDPSLPSVIQYHWDTWLKDSRIFLILSGSSISMMEEMTLQYKSPLFGRRTGQCLIKPLRFVHILDYCGDLKQAAELYAVFGGTPAYIAKADLGQDIYSNIKRKILSEDSVLFRETEFILRTEITEPRYYFSILRAIAEGNCTSAKISQHTGIERSTISKYLQVLVELYLITREIPSGEPDKSKKGRYFLSDNYFSFWFFYVYPNSKLIEMGNSASLMEDTIKPTFSAYIGRLFESCIKDLLWDFNERKLLPFTFVDCSRWWYREDEIDLVADNDENILFCEVKWQDTVNAMALYSRLSGKAERYHAYHKKEKVQKNTYYLLIAKSFQDSSLVSDNSVFVWDIRTLSEMFFNTTSPRPETPEKV